MTQPLSYRPPSDAMFYRPPRRCEPGVTLLTLALSLVLLIVGSVAYVRLSHSFGSIHYRVGAVVVAMVCVGALAAMPVRFGRVRSRVLAAVLGAGFGLIALYVMWVVWIHDVLERMNFSVDWTRLILAPSALFAFMKIIAREGAWFYNDRLVRGLPLVILWISEAGMMLGCGVLMAISQVGDLKPRCERCRALCKSPARLRRFSAEHEEALLAAVESRQFESLRELPGPEHEDAPELDLKLLSCPECGETNMVSVTRIWWSTATDVPKVATKRLLENLLITPTETLTLRHVAAKVEAVEEPEDTSEHNV